MHKARAFFFVCAGIFLLALAYHLGARSAGAQSAGTVEGADITPALQGAYGETVTFCVNRVLYQSEFASYGWFPVPAAAVMSVPGTSPIVATSRNVVFLANGDVYRYPFGYGGNLLGANPTPAQSISIGQLKAKYAK